ncbi:MAG: hypothetical protein DRH26_00695 [Deltaproteobacteria bacterium]|nr:MAG: hypothetical protein DRH26_00695 [Deltaproteobacteria bacterium]
MGHFSPGPNGGFSVFTWIVLFVILCFVIDEFRKPKRKPFKKIPMESDNEFSEKHKKNFLDI